MDFSTMAIHEGQAPDAATGATVVPVYQTSTFTQQGIGEHKGFEYSRLSNPTRTALEVSLAALEHARYGLAFASGMAAEHAVFSLLNPGDHIVTVANVYGGTVRLFERLFSRYGITFSYVEGSDAQEFEGAIGSNTKLIWLETPTNPLLTIVDIEAVAAIARARGVLLAVDNTFASPYFQRPLELGADIVVQSTTKYIAGHSDVIGGAVLLNDASIYEELRFFQNTIGAIPGPQDVWLTLRGVKTLAVRMRQHEANAFAVARFLQDHPRVSQVYFPGLPQHPNHEVARRQMSGFGGMVSFRLKEGNRESVNAFVKKLKVFSLADSLGGVESLVCFPMVMTHDAVPEKQRLELGITGDLLRLSIGIEGIDDLLADLKQALA
ncbi:MAG: cystathionine gamma-synthase [Parabacteroides sp.]|jgi:cystathionine beta-lyase/cystathionine gamma-synthase|uniref:cystathionine gamma-synthase n=2 Tax=Macellibacteroides fermentans TaxID=879969 RepID=UPI000829A09A|nr:cystathionine gamma-synthase [Parabacteroides sp.]MDD3508531.1 cystathionine gamma-synthase [Parabacteroides sp.]OCW95252.1 cystathionine gamma-synthase [Macellibacteroides sp. HH-ZS]